MKYSFRLLFKSSFLFFIVVAFFPQMAEAKDALSAESIDIPFDGGLSVLIAAGIGYGVKRFRDNKERQPSENNSLQ